MIEIIHTVPAKRGTCPVYPNSMVYQIAAHIHATGAPISFEAALTQFSPGRYRTRKIGPINDAIGTGWLHLEAGNLTLGRVAARWFHVPAPVDQVPRGVAPPAYRASVFSAPLNKKYIPSEHSRTPRRCRSCALHLLQDLADRGRATGARRCFEGGSMTPALIAAITIDQWAEQKVADLVTDAHISNAERLIKHKRVMAEHSARGLANFQRAKARTAKVRAAKGPK